MSDEDLRSRIGRSFGIRTLIQLVIASVVVGAIFSFIGVSPREFWSGIYDTFQGIISSLGESFAETKFCERFCLHTVSSAHESALHEPMRGEYLTI